MVKNLANPMADAGALANPMVDGPSGSCESLFRMPGIIDTGIATFGAPYVVARSDEIEKFGKQTHSISPSSIAAIESASCASSQPTYVFAVVLMSACPRSI